MSKAKAKGTQAEVAVRDYLRGHGYPMERLPPEGGKDRGDLAGLEGVVVEVKNQRTMNLAGWVDEAIIERCNAGASVGVVFHKRVGKGFPGDWYVSMSGSDFVALLKRGA